MARKINPDKPLSDKDRQWLTDWNRIAQIKEHDLAHPPKGARSEPEPEPDEAGGLQSGSDSSGEQEEPTDPEKGEPDSPAAQESEPDDEDDDGDWYEDEGVTNDHLKDELGKRELSKSGNKDELIARLREDDAADEG